MLFWSCLLLAEFVINSKATTIINLSSDQHGTIESPNFPKPYPNDVDLSWQLQAPEGYQVEVYFTVFNLENSYDEDLGGSCVYDYISIDHLGRNKRFCGNYSDFPDDARVTIQQRFRSSNMTIRFVSDYSNEFSYSGFKAHFKVKDKDECDEMREIVRTTFDGWDELVYCNHYCVNVPGSYHCTCRPGFELHENQHTCKASCENEMITATEGVITSPDYPEAYSRLTDCKWTIRVEAGFSLNLQFNGKFEIENHINYTDCQYDYLKIRYSEIEKEFCHDLPNNGSLIATNAREVKLQFHTDNSIELAGFNVHFTTTKIRCNDARDAPENGRKSENPKGYYEFQDVVQFFCIPGYNLIGSRSITCQNDGTWTNTTPVCQIKSCGYPHFLGNVSYSRLRHAKNILYNFRDTVRVECIEWYEMVFGEDNWRCSENAEWIPTAENSDASLVPICSPICGTKNGGSRPSFEEKISNGQETEPHEWPWLIFVHQGHRPNFISPSASCGGALISPNYVLTAAHCIAGTDSHFYPGGFARPDIVFVWPGLHSRTFYTTPRPRHVAVQRVFPHPRYNATSVNFDFALLELSQTLTMSDKVRPICLPNTTEDFSLMNLGNTSGVVAGWGIDSVTNRPSPVLQHTLMPTVTNKHCWNVFTLAARYYKLNIKEKTLNENKFCGGDEYGGAGAPCKGDSGGPFMVENEANEKYYAFGLVSYGISCHTQELNDSVRTSVSYSVFARLNTNVVHWINNKILN